MPSCNCTQPHGHPSSSNTRLLFSQSLPSASLRCRRRHRASTRRRSPRGGQGARTRCRHRRNRRTGAALRRLRGSVRSCLARLLGRRPGRAARDSARRFGPRAAQAAARAPARHVAQHRHGSHRTRGLGRLRAPPVLHLEVGLSVRGTGRGVSGCARGGARVVGRVARGGHGRLLRRARAAARSQRVQAAAQEAHACGCRASGHGRTWRSLRTSVVILRPGSSCSPSRSRCSSSMHSCARATQWAWVRRPYRRGARTGRQAHAAAHATSTPHYTLGGSCLQGPP
jgi:hypothetical protein